MPQTFPVEKLTDQERCRRAADWLQTGLNDLDLAIELLTDPSDRQTACLLRGRTADLSEALRKKSSAT